MNPFYPLATTSWDHVEVDAIQKVIKTGMYTMGSHVAECEKKFAEFLGSPYCVMVSSGSTANLIMVAALFYRKENHSSVVMKLLFQRYPGAQRIIHCISMD